jgi:methionyl-tRNA formyltransferase
MSSEILGKSIVYMGTPEFAVAPLKALIEANITVAAVVTVADKPAGRGRKLNESAVKKAALAHDIPVLQPVSLKDESFLNELAAIKADLFVVVAFRMLPEAVWNMPPLGSLNLHGSLLPHYRGAAPINWAVINGEKTTGVTTFFIDEKIDTGEIILQSQIMINPSENAGSLHDKLMKLGTKLVIKTIEQIEFCSVKTHAQSTEKTKTAHKLNKDNCKINWNSSVESIYNKVRGLNPYPAAWGLLSNGNKQFNIKIYKVQKHLVKHNFQIGKLIITKKSIKIAVTEGYIELINFKFPGKRQMDTTSFLNGFTFHENAKML